MTAHLTDVPTGPLESAGDPVVSVIMPVYNVERYLEQAMRSVLSQTLRRVELIVVNDRSTDRSGEIIERVAAEDTRVRHILLEENGGQGFARNRGLDEARGKFIFFLDSDDVLASTEVLARLVDAAERHRAQLVRGRRLNAGADIYPEGTFPRDVCETYFGSEERVGTLEQCPEILHNRHIWLLLYERALLQGRNIRFTNPQWEERPFAMACYLAASRMVLTDVEVVIYRAREQSTSRRRLGARDLELFLRNAEAIASLLADYDGPLGEEVLRTAKRFHVSQYVAFVFRGKWLEVPEIVHDSALRTRALERITTSLERCRVSPAEIGAEPHAVRKVDLQTGVLQLFYALLRAREFDVALSLRARGNLSSSWALAQYSRPADDELLGACNAWLTHRDWFEDLPSAAAARIRAVAARRSMPRMVLHIGSTKTGSTYLQHLCDRNRAALLRQGIWYPPFGYYRQPGRPRKTAGHADFVSAARRRDPSLRDFLYASLEHLPFEVHTIVLSSEAFFLIDEGAERELIAYFDGFPIEVAVYLRRQDEWANSQYLEFVAGGAVGRVQDAIGTWLEEDKTKRRMDYARLVQRWSDAVGPTHLRVRAYEQAQFAGGTLVRDFAQLIGLEDPDLLLPIDRAGRNEPTLGTPHVDVMRFFNGLPFPTTGSYLSFVEAVTAALARSGGARTMLLSPERRRAILSAHEASNAEVARRYLGRDSGELFYDLSVPDEEEARPSTIPIADLERMFRAYQESVREGAVTTGRVHRDARGAIRSIEVLGRQFPPKVARLRSLEAHDFLMAIALLAPSVDPIPVATIERYARQIVAGELTKRRAAICVLREHGGGIVASHLPWLEKAKLSLYDIYARCAEAVGA